ncbi:MAG: ornithine cyclodeaminase [Burkholderiales bacterium]|nr:ornithine cyclodeaminase [Burkholderiales bacterium]MBH2016989.1 ornithine cyclodeaminase [Burkholderiales bacterium]
MNRPTLPSRRTSTRYLSVDDIVGIVQRKGLVPCLQGLADAIERDFRRWPMFDASARVASHSEVGVIELMPISDGRHYSFKYVNGHPGNGQHSLPTVMAFGLLAEVATGLPLLLSELTLTTALRTAATSVVAARALARPGSRVMAVIGNGAQSEFQCLAFHHLLGIDTVRLFDIDADATHKLASHLALQRPPGSLKVERCHSAAHAVQGADIVTTLTADKACATIVTADLLAPGMHLNAVGGDCPGKTELAPGVLQAARVFVEFEPQTRLEGDLQQMPPDFPVTELWRVLCGQASGRLSASDVTVFDSVGFALEDFSALSFMRDCADELGLTRTLSLIPELDHPKDLFAMLNPLAPRRQRQAA